MGGIELLNALEDGNEKSQRPMTASTDLKMVLCVQWGTCRIELALGSEVARSAKHAHSMPSMQTVHGLATRRDFF